MGHPSSVLTGRVRVIIGDIKDRDPSASGSGHRLHPLLALVTAIGLFAAVSVAGAGPSAPVVEEKDLRFGVAAYLSAPRMERLYAPMAMAFGRTLQKPVVFRTSSTFARYFDRLTEGSYDITLVHALFYVEAVDNYDYVPIARMIEPFKGLVVVLEQSPVRSIDDLLGQTIATPPDYLPTVLLVRRTLRQSQLDPDRDVTLKSFKSVESCLQQLVIGEAAACICPPFALPGAERRMQVRFRTVLESPSIPNLTFVAHSRVPQPERQRLRDAIVGWSDNEEGRRLLRSIGTRGFVEARDPEYEAVRRLMEEFDRAWLPSLR